MKVKNQEFERYFSKLAKNMSISRLREYVQASEGDPNTIMLSGGRPHEGVFPVGTKASIEIQEPTSEFVNTETGQQKVDTVVVELSPTDLNYNGTTYSRGLPDLVQLAKEVLLYPYNPLQGMQDVYDSCLTSGATDGLAKVVDLISDPGDVILCANYAYPGLVSCAKPKNRVLCRVAMDKGGMCPLSLESNLQSLEKEGKVPKFVYIVPTAQNPTTITMSEQRKRSIYEVCRKHDILIVSDEPYFLIQLGDDPAPLSFLEIDAKYVRERGETCGIIIRLETLSKTMFPGLRLGMTTAPIPLINKLNMYTQITSWGLSGINQKLLYGILKRFGKSGYQRHVGQLSKIYKARKDVFCASLNEGKKKYNLSDKDLTFEDPKQGMFLWVDLPFLEGKDTENYLQDFIAAKLSVVPGNAFLPRGQKSTNLRLSFAYLGKETLQSSGLEIARVVSIIKQRIKL